MLILSKDRNCLVNMNNMLELCVVGEYIQAIPLNNTMAITLGRYDSEGRTKEVFAEIVSHCGDDFYRMPCR